jgi:hypothetical protein
MSQAGIISTSGGPVPPQVPTTFVGDTGSATPAANTLTVPGGTSTDNNTNGIQTSGSGATLTIELTNRVPGSATTNDDSTPQTLYTFPLGATPGTYTFFARVAAYNSTDTLGAGYTSFAIVRTTGAAGTVLGSTVAIADEEGAMSGVLVENNVSGNNYVLTATGLAGKTIAFVALTEYVFAS